METAGAVLMEAVEVIVEEVEAIVVGAGARVEVFYIFCIKNN